MSGKVKDDDGTVALDAVTTGGDQFSIIFEESDELNSLFMQLFELDQNCPILQIPYMQLWMLSLFSRCYQSMILTDLYDRYSLSVLFIVILSIEFGKVDYYNPAY